MKFLTFRKITKCYIKWKDNDAYLDILSSFLVECIEDSLLKKFDDTQFKSISGNSYYLRILNSNKVLIGLLFSEDNPQEIIIDKKNLKGIIANWLKLKKENVDEIVITRNKNNKIFIIGRFLTDEEKSKHNQGLKLWHDTPKELKQDKHYFEEFQNKWYKFSFEELKQLEHEFYIAAMDDKLAEWDTNEQ